MLDTKNFITTIRTKIANETTLAITDVYSPDLPSEKQNIIAVTLLAGSSENTLCGVSTFDLSFRTIIRGTNNDSDTRGLADEIYNALHLKSAEGIVQIIAVTTPIFVGKDQNNNNVYNITYRTIVEGDK